MISVVCVYNRPDVFDRYLRASLNQQDVEYELIAINNCDGSYESAAKALNSGGREARGDYIMFAHQDISFSSRDFLSETERILRPIRDLGAAGLAGKRAGSPVLTHLTHGDPPYPAGIRDFRDAVEVQTVDECLIVVPRTVFGYLEFDEQVCDAWHLYAVEYALSAKERGLKIVVLPLSGYHKSAGTSMNKDYYRTLKRVVAKHRMHHKRIFTSMGDWSTRVPVPFLQYRYELGCWRLRKMGRLRRRRRE